MSQQLSENHFGAMKQEKVCPKENIFELKAELAALKIEHHFDLKD